jgi:hypothetical protein
MLNIRGGCGAMSGPNYEDLLCFSGAQAAPFLKMSQKRGGRALACGRLKAVAYANMAGAENQTLGPGLEFGLEPGGPIELGSQAIIVSRKDELSFCQGCDMIACFTK